MMIGKRGAATTAISAGRADGVSIRGKSLARDLMGEMGFTEFFYFLSTGKPPTEAQQFFLDMSLVGLAEHGLTPSVQAARMTYAADPAALHGAVAAGILGCGTVILGAARLCGDLIAEVYAKRDAGAPLADAALAVAREYRTAKRPIPGFGHPLHKPVDPRAERMISLSEEMGVAGPAVAAAKALQVAVNEAWGKPLPMNISMSIAATLADVGVPPSVIRGVPILARAAGLLAHLGEESETPIGFLLAATAEEAIEHTATFGEDEN